MPLQFYAPLKPPCRLCGAGFEHRQPGNTPDLAACPKCGLRVRRVTAQAVNSPKLSAPLSVSRARQAGFTVLKRTSAGEYERQ
jgi:putative FmdB family regulatory protein